jgi:predicted Zn finger-like uncharacterized protein
MKIICKNCNATYNLSEDKIPLKTKIAKCKKCNADMKILGKEDMSKLSAIRNSAANLTVSQPKVVASEHKETKKCDFCGEEVLAIAKKCKHCGEILDPALRQVEELKRQVVSLSNNENSKPVIVLNSIPNVSEEKTLYKAGAHYFIFLPSIAIVLLGLLFLNLKSIVLIFLGLTLFVFGIIDFIKAIITKLSVELIGTSKRIIVKKGLIHKNIIEFDHAKIENFSIEQSFLGKILDYGNITINGIGVGKTLVENIQSPVSLCKKIAEDIERNQHNAPNVILNITLIPSLNFLNNVSEKKKVAFLAFSLGWLGIHNFYLNKQLFGFFYLIISVVSLIKDELNALILVPLIFAIIEGLYYLFIPDKTFEEILKPVQKNNSNMMNCPECKAEVSKKALKCPHCGVRIQKPKRGFLGAIILLLFIVVTFMLVMVVTGSNNGQNIPSNTNSIVGTWLVLLFLTLLTRPKN